MHVEIHDQVTKKTYIASSEAECHDATDRRAYDLATTTGEDIKLGSVLATPINTPARKAAFGVGGS